ncbi:MAG: DEAD/DEAH box helicase family protein [Cellulosilyticum sp.]|nr:DEAD/DEAH box helicase family protein [Cellulosilyticum sp.]
MTCELTSGLFITDLTKEQCDSIKQDLTFDNPEFLNAKRYSRIDPRYITIPKTISYYHEGTYEQGGEEKRYISVPMGVDLYKYTDDIKFIECRKTTDVKFPQFQLDLRQVQAEAEKVYLENQGNPYKPKSLIQLPTGKGKTILALHIAKTLGQKTLVLVHKNDLVTGWQKDIKQCFGDEIKCGLIKAKSRIIGEQITISTVQTLSRLGEPVKSALFTAFGLVIVDEVHHIGSNVFNILNEFQSRYKLGLSATPKRTDGRNYVFDLFLGGLAYRYVPTKDDEDILPVTVRVRNSRAKYLPFLHEGKVFNSADFSEKELPKKINYIEDMPYKSRPKIPFLIIDSHLVESPRHLVQVCHDILTNYRLGKSCIAFFTQKEHIRQYYRYLSRYVPKEEIITYYGDAKEKDDAMLEKAESKKALITLATYSKATEGTNVKAWEVGFFVSSINNSKNVEQAVGRIRRSKEGKKEAILYDYRFNDSYSVSRHGITRDKTYKTLGFTIEGKTMKKGYFNRGYI